MDTSVIVRESFFRSPSAILFLKATQFLGIKIIIPQVVIDEVIGKYSQHLIDVHAQFNKQRRKIYNLTNKEVPELNLEDEIKEFRGWLKRISKANNWEVIPYPRLTLRKIVRESYKFKKPFKENGEGYKDYVIWSSIASYVNNQDADEESYFMTGNTKDFCEEKGGNLFLHSDLLEWLEVGKESMELFTELRGFFDKHIRPKLKGVDESNMPDLSLDQLQQIAIEHTEEFLTYYSTFGIEGLQFENDVTISGVENVTITDWQIAEMDQDEFLISFSGMADLEVDGFMDKMEYILGDYEDIYVIDRDWNERVMAVSQMIQTPFQVEMIYSTWLADVGGYSVRLENEYTDY